MVLIITASQITKFEQTKEAKKVQHNGDGQLHEEVHCDAANKNKPISKIFVYADGEFKKRKLSLNGFNSTDTFTYDGKTAL